MRKRLSLWILVFILLLGAVNAESVDVRHGKSYYAELETTSLSINWGGITVNNDYTSIGESDSPIASYPLNSPIIVNLDDFPGYNMKDGVHYYGAMIPDSFDLGNVENVSVSDLMSGQMFNPADFSVFYPNYDQKNDNPYETFCCDTKSIMLGGINFTAFVVNLEQDVTYYLLKYDDGGDEQPLVLSEFEDSTCYNDLPCVSEFMLPPISGSYNFYILNKYQIFDYNVWVDGVSTKSIPQTGLPYNLTVQVLNYYSKQPVPNVSVVLGEQGGNNLFIPYPVSGYISTAYSVGRTDPNGMETFLFAPTAYSNAGSYQAFLGVITYELGSLDPLTILNKDGVVKQSKPLQPSTLYDNAKTTVNSMNQIVSYLYKWSSQREEAKEFTVSYELNTGSFSVTDHTDGTGTLRVKTGAPNVITAAVYQGGTYRDDYYVRVREQDGFLVLNPYTADMPLSGKDRLHMQEVPVGQEFVITPTALGTIESNVTLEIVDSGGTVVDTYQGTIDNNINIVSGGNDYDNDLLKTTVNVMNIMLNSLFYSLNN